VITETIIQALDRIGRTPDGEVLRRYLLSVVLEVSSQPDDGALREHNGRRRFASDLMTHMGEGTDGRRTGSSDTTDDRSTERPKHRRSVREWIAEQPGWYDEPSTDDAKPATDGGDAS
jgi:hypothetical protein